MSIWRHYRGKHTTVPVIAAPAPVTDTNVQVVSAVDAEAAARAEFTSNQKLATWGALVPKPPAGTDVQGGSDLDDQATALEKSASGQTLTTWEALVLREDAEKEIAETAQEIAP